MEEGRRGGVRSGSGREACGEQLIRGRDSDAGECVSEK